MLNYQTPRDPLAVSTSFTTIFDWGYDTEAAELVRLYEKAKKKQWNAASRIDWSVPIDPENPLDVPDSTIALCETDTYRKMSRAQQIDFRVHYHAWRVSQFLHGEQGALVCSAKTVQQAPLLSNKLFAATQVIDEARHVEAYSRLLSDKFSVSYPIVSGLRNLLDNVVADSRWDMTYLGMQVLVEGLALAAFSSLRDLTQNSLVAAINAFVMEDEARHVAFGRTTLRAFYPQLTQAERDEREEFAAEACFALRESLDADDLCERFGIPRSEVEGSSATARARVRFRAPLFRRIVPMMRDIGLWGPKIRDAYQKMGILALGQVDIDKLQEEDESIAASHDREGIARQLRVIDGERAQTGEPKDSGI